MRENAEQDAAEEASVSLQHQPLRKLQADKMGISRRLIPIFAYCIKVCFVRHFLAYGKANFGEKEKAAMGCIAAFLLVVFSAEYSACTEV